MWFSRGHPLFHAAPSSGPAVFFASCSCWHPLNGSCQGILRPQPLWPLFPPSSLTILPSLHAAWLSLPFLALHGQPSSPLGSSGPSSVTPRLTGLLPENPFSPEPVPTPCPVCAQPSAAHTPGQYGPSVSPPPLHCMCARAQACWRSLLHNSVASGQAGCPGIPRHGAEGGGAPCAMPLPPIAWESCCLLWGLRIPTGLLGAPTTPPVFPGAFSSPAANTCPHFPLFMGKPCRPHTSPIFLVLRKHCFSSFLREMMDTHSQDSHANVVGAPPLRALSVGLIPLQAVRGRWVSL